MIDGQETQSLPEQMQEDGQPLKRSFIEQHGISPILFAFISLVVIFILYQIAGGIAVALIFGFTPTAENIVGFRIATGAGEVLLILLPTLLLARFASLTPREFLRMKLPDVRMLIVPLIGIFSLQQLLEMYLFLQEKIPLPRLIEEHIHQFKEMMEEMYKMLASSHSIAELFFVIFIVALIPALAEELMFRGLIQRSFEKGLNPTKGIILTGIIFGAYHLNPFSIIPLVFLGIYLGFLAMRANSIWVSVAAHFYNNAIACIAAYVNRDDFLVTGDPGTMSAGAFVATFLFFSLLFVFSTYYFMQITERAYLPVNS